MPLYDFHCKDCDQTVELLIKVSEVPVCSNCGGQNMEKQVSKVAAPGKSAAFIAKSRAQAAKEGHFSNFSSSERPKGT
jgi:putative FmdB family regulatory protein